jgi:DNA-binding winged helix-turn-helix (wHTH) protein
MPKRVEEHPVLIAQTGPLKGQRFVLDRALVIGRESSCDVTIPDRQVSRFHARVTPEAGNVMLEDLGSKNGTHRNGESISGSVDLKDGDLVQIALIQSFMFLTSDATLPLTEELTRPGRLRLDTRSRGVWVNDQSIEPPLSALQFHVLNVLCENGGQVVERAKLVSEAWGDEEAVGVSDEALDALLRRLRERIAAVDSTHNYIVTVRGHGVRLDNPPVE